MNKLLVVVFDNEPAADAGLQALRTLHAAGDITLYATGVLAKDASGVVRVRSRWTLARSARSRAWRSAA